MTVSCDHVQDVLVRWCPSTDLPDPVVGHVDDCAACRATFDARFAPVAPPVVSLPPVGAPPVLRMAPLAWAVAMAAAVLLLVQLPSLEASDDLMAAAEPQICPEEPWAPPECPA
ncbi:MAG: hypothetical protein KTR31_07870 [Myxococcales bacterium]|nr:hypothetical protein [Myxococcales bacterium]